MSIWRGLAFGVLGGPAVLFLPAVVLAVRGKIGTAFEVLGVGAAFTVLPGLAVGVTLALTRLDRNRVVNLPLQGGLAGGAAFFAQNAVMGVISAGVGWAVIGVFGTPIVAGAGILASRFIIRADLTPQMRNAT